MKIEPHYRILLKNEIFRPVGIEIMLNNGFSIEEIINTSIIDFLKLGTTTTYHIEQYTIDILFGIHLLNKVLDYIVINVYVPEKEKGSGDCRHQKGYRIISASHNIGTAQPSEYESLTKIFVKKTLNNLQVKGKLRFG